MGSQRNLFAVLFVLFVLVLFVVPVSAQEVVAEPTTSVTWGVDPNNPLTIFIIVGLIGWMFAALVAVFRSSPPGTYSSIMTLLQQLPQMAEGIIKLTPTKADDQLLAQFNELKVQLIADLKQIISDEQMAAVRRVLEDILLKNDDPGPTAIAESVMKADEAIFGPNSKTVGGGDNLPDPVPAGGQGAVSVSRTSDNGHCDGMAGF